LNRLQAMVMLKALVDNDLVEPSYISLNEVNTDECQIQIKCNYRRKEIEAYAKKFGVTLTEDNEHKYLLIFEP